MPENSKKLTKRELQVAQLVAQGLKYKEIASSLGLGYETVKTYATRVRRKLGVNSKVGIAMWAMKQENNDA